MTTATQDAFLLVIAAANVVATGVYGFVAYRLFQRPVSTGARLASAQFSLWWGGLGASTAVTAAEMTLFAGHLLPFALALTLTLLTDLIDVVLLWGLVGFLVYVYWGRYYLLAVSAFFAALYVAALYYTLAESPYALVAQGGLPTLEYAAAPNAGLTAFILIGILGPELVGAGLYLSLLRRVRDRTQRYRILLVGTSIFLWFALDIAVPSATLAGLFAKSLLQVVPALLSLVAFLPPEWIRRRLGVGVVPGPEGTRRGGVAQL